MTTDQFDNNNNNDKVREVTQDRRNVSSNMGKRQEPASLSFDFDNRPGEADGLDFSFDNKPADTVRPVREEVPETAPPEAPVTEISQTFQRNSALQRSP